MSFEISSADALMLMPKFASTLKALIENKEKLSEMAQTPLPCDFPGNEKLPVIIAKDLSVEKKTALITILKSHKRAIAWKLSDIKGINLEFYTYQIPMEEDFEPAV
nr:reverse transcriptase domain-containing protein, chloroplastic [Tanacetum cinerariifolium]